jgi:peptide/nickel transport system substrate-binding protein
MRLGLIKCCIITAICVLTDTVYAQENTAPVHANAIALHDDPALPLGFGHFPYANPDAPQGGRLRLGMMGTFDTLNPFTVPGTAAQGITNNVVETLMARNYDEPFTLYGLIAETIATPPDRSFVEFKINPRARFSDGKPVTAQDVLFSWELLRDHGRPNHRAYYSKVKAAKALDEHTVRFDLAGNDDRELPLILGLMPVLPRYATPTDHFARTGFVPLLGSGPYKVSEVLPGQSITLKRDRNYWGNGLPTRRGMFNVDELRYDYYRDGNTLFEAFKKGLYDYREETSPANWAQGYGFAAVKKGETVTETIPRRLPAGMNGLAFNTRRDLFHDIRVRQALILMLDFEWINATLHHGLYRRTQSYFDQSELASTGRSADERERTWLIPFRSAVRTDIMDGRWTPPTSDGSGRDRGNIRQALALLDQAGWVMDKGVLTAKKDKIAFSFELLVRTRDHERLALAYAKQLTAVGIQARVRFVDALQFERRMQAYDFDMAPWFWFASLAPGNEQTFYWGSKAADTPGTRNYPGIQSPGVDAMIAHIQEAQSRAELVSAVRALDRLLLSGAYAVPLYHAPDYWVARKKSVRHPEKIPLHGPLVETFWQEKTE